jgi:hypothetical protein
MDGPLDDNAVVLTAAKASVPGPRLLELIDLAQEYLESQSAAYDRQYECVYEDTAQTVFFVEEGHWAELGTDLDIPRREWNALQRAHREHLEKLSRDLDRHEEFLTALEVRETVVIGTAGHPE